MPPRRAIYGNISKAVFIANKGPEVTAIDQQLLLSRLLFFDEVVVDSTNLGELPYLAKMFGLDGLQELLNSNLLKLATQKSFVVTDTKLNGKRQIPLLQFDEGIATSHDNDHNLERKMKSLLKISGLSNAEREELDHFVRSKLVKPSPSYGTKLLAQIRKDLTSNIDLLKTVLCHRRPQISNENLSLTVHDLGGMQRFESNLQSMLGITKEQEHQILAEVVTGVSNLNQRIADMEEYSAISHFEENEAPLLFGKVHSIVAPINPKFEEHAFLRVISVTDIPELITNRKINVEELLKVRATDECREFRSWLSTTDHVDDAELKRMLRGFRAKAASFVASSSGKTLRLAVNTALGFAGPLPALIEGAADTFLIDKLLPSSGVLTFLNHSMPSIFTSASESYR